MKVNCLDRTLLAFSPAISKLLTGVTPTSLTPLSRRLFRDSQGRARCERSLFVGPNIAERIRIVEITGYVPGYHYTLDPQSKIAYRTPRPSAPRPDTAAPTADSVTQTAPSSSAVATLDSNGSVRVGNGARIAGSPPPRTRIHRPSLSPRFRRVRHTPPVRKRIHWVPG